jgi:hypothetical protein
VNFWDTSALVPLLIEERQSRACRDLYRSDAAAMTYFEPVHRPGFVVVDRGLAHAAKAQGFTVYPGRPSRRQRKG